MFICSQFHTMKWRLTEKSACWETVWRQFLKWIILIFVSYLCCCFEPHCWLLIVYFMYCIIFRYARLRSYRRYILTTILDFTDRVSSLVHEFWHCHLNLAKFYGVQKTFSTTSVSIFLHFYEDFVYTYCHIFDKVKWSKRDS